MENCIVTKISESISGDFATLNTVFLDYDGECGDTNIVLLIAAGSTGSVKVTFSTPFHEGGDSGTRKSSATIAAGTKQIYVATKAELGTSAINKLVKVEDIYNLKALLSYGRCLSINYNKSYGIQSILNYSPIEMIGGVYTGTTAIDLKKYTYIGAEDDSNYSYRINPTDSSEYIVGYNIVRNSYNSYGPVVGLRSEVGENNSIKVMVGVRPYGSCVNLPINVKVVDVGTGMLSGNIEDMVSRMRTAGRTSGAIALHYPYSASSLKYNDTAIKTLVTNSTIPYDTTNEATYLTWDANTITFTDTKPSELNDYFPFNTSPWAWSELHLVLS